jgi:MFS family permease
MKRATFYLLVASSISIGAAAGLMDTILPLYLREEIEFSYKNLGWIYFTAAIVMIVMRMLIARHSDHMGRRRIYAAGLIIAGMAAFLPPLIGVCKHAGFIALAMVCAVAVKILFNLGRVARQTLQGAMIYEETGKGRFLGLFGKISAPLFLSIAISSLVAGYLLKFTGYNLLFFMGGGQLIAMGIYFLFHFDETGPERKQTRPKNSLLKDLRTSPLRKELWIIGTTSMITGVGVGCSHGFIMPLFFREHFHCSRAQVGAILALHATMIGLGMLIAMRKRHLPPRYSYVFFLTIQGLSLALTGLMPTLTLALSVWMLHDLIGSSQWITMRAAIMQHYADPDNRAFDNSRVQVMNAVGFSGGHLLAGALAEINLILPFTVGGMIIMAAGISILRLRNPDLDDPEMIAQPMEVAN